MAFPPPPGAGPPAPPGRAGAPPMSMGTVPPPPKKKVRMDEVSDFDFTAEDVRNAAKDILERLPPAAPVQGATGPVLACLVTGNRNSKTVASIAVGTTACKGLPRPPGSRVVVIYWDTQAESSFDNFLATSGVQLAEGEERPWFIPMRQRWGRYRGLEDAGSPACRTYMVLVFNEVLKGLRARMDIGGLVIDRAEILIEDHGSDVALYYAGAQDFSDLNPGDWKPRQRMWRTTDELMRTTPIPGGWVVVNGARDKAEGDKVTVIGPGGRRSQEIVPSKWASRIGANYPVEIQSSHTRSEAGEDAWVYDCTVGRWHGFQAGRKLDGKNRSIGVFMES